MQNNKRVIALGFFDGVHIGHAALLKAARERAALCDASPSALTFDVPPETYITGRRLPLIQQAGSRADCMRRLHGIDEVVVMRFDELLMKTPWQRFVSDTLAGGLNAVGLVAGHDFHFGHCGEGNAERLAGLCHTLNMTCDIVKRVELDGIAVSSTYIRKLIAQGEVERAARFLSRPYGFVLPVARGRGLGRGLGFPTVNMALPQELQRPAAGVYLSRVLVGNKIWPSVTNIGVRPTVSTEDGEFLAESHLFGFDGDLYGQTLKVELLKFMRPERKFDGLDALKRQVAADLRDALGAHGQSNVIP